MYNFNNVAPVNLAPERKNFRNMGVFFLTCKAYLCTLPDRISKHCTSIIG